MTDSTTTNTQRNACFRGHSWVRCAYCGKDIPGHPDPSGVKLYPFQKKCECGELTVYTVGKAYTPEVKKQEGTMAIKERFLSFFRHILYRIRSLKSKDVCSFCDGLGEIDCPGCHSKPPGVPCPDCGDSWVITCPDCKGEG